jgi:hypothetical protein
MVARGESRIDAVGPHVLLLIWGGGLGQAGQDGGHVRECFESVKRLRQDVFSSV